MQATTTPKAAPQPDPNTHIVIMAGGIGSRFWPASRQHLPKQFLDILGTGQSLLRQTFERLSSLSQPQHIWVLTNASYRHLVLQHLPELQPHQVLTEPAMRNTAPAIAYAATHIQHHHPEANLVIAPSDHLVLKPQVLLSALSQGLSFTATHPALLTLGIQPTRPDTGYGYIQYRPTATAPCPVLRFTEKPQLQQAEQFLAQGNYLWNAGLFIARASTLLQSFYQYAPVIHQFFSDFAPLIGTGADEQALEQGYPKLPAISIDYAIMEQANNVYTLPADIGWSDLGTWASLYEVAHKDPHHNVVQANATLFSDSTHNIVRAPAGKLVVLHQLSGYIIVDEGDILLIAPKHHEQHIKHLTNTLRDQPSGSSYL